MNSSQLIDTEKVLSFVEETETAVLLLDEGIRIIEAHDGGLDRRIVAVHLIAQGFERFLKLTRAQIQLSRNGELPSTHEVKRWGHRLLELLDATVDELEQDDSFTAVPAVRSDLGYLLGEERFRDLFAILDESLPAGGTTTLTSCSADDQKHDRRSTDGTSMK